MGEVEWGCMEEINEYGARLGPYDTALAHSLAVVIVVEMGGVRYHSLNHFQKDIPREIQKSGGRRTRLNQVCEALSATSPSVL